MVMVTKVKGECVGFQRLKTVIPNSLPKKEIKEKLLALIEINVKLSKRKYSILRGLSYQIISIIIKFRKVFLIFIYNFIQERMTFFYIEVLPQFS